MPTVIKEDDPNAPLLSVLLQETDRFSKLREAIYKDLSDVQKGIKGLVGMSQHLDEIANAIY